MKKKLLSYGLFNLSKQFHKISLLFVSIFILCSTTQTYAECVYSQNVNISLSFKNVAISKVLTEIEEQSEFYFLYNSSLVDVNRKVNINVSNEKITTIIDKLFKNSVEYYVNDKQIVLAPKLKQQSNKVKGVVLSEGRELLPGVSVYVKSNVNIGTTTDMEGSFSIDAKKGDILVFSFIGMKTLEVKIENIAKGLNITMKEDRVDVDEVMVVAYGTASKKSFTGSAEVVNNKIITSTSSNSVSTALLGRVAGVQVASSTAEAGASSAIRIRGVGSFNAGSSPLYVIDGVVGAPMPNTEDVENTTVLKDAAAASLYGSRAANGVIIITTKKGKGDLRFNIKYKNTLSWKSPDNFKMMNADQYMAKTWEGLFNSKYYKSKKDKATSAAYAHKTLKNVTGANPYAYLDASTGKYLPLDTPFDDNGKLKSEAVLMYETDWLGEAYRVGKTNDFHISASKGDEKSNLYTSLSYFDQEGIVIENNYKKLAASLNCSVIVNNIIEYGFNSDLRYSEGRQYNSTLLSDAYRFNPVIPIYQLDNNFMPKTDDLGNKIYNWNNPINNDYNIHAQLHFNKDGYENKSMYASPHINLTPFKGFAINAKASARLESGTSHWFAYPLHGAGVAKKGMSNRYSWDSKSYYGLVMGSYDTKIGLHSINLKLGYEVEDYSSTYISATAKGYELWDTLKELENGEVADDVESGNDFNSAYSGSKLSYISNLEYGYADKYYLSASYRRDGTSKVGPDSRWGNFWSVGGTWRASEEMFIKNLSFINNLKLRASYGVNGNDNVGNYQALDLYGLNNKYLDKIAAVYERVGNANLEWEKNKNFTVALEFGLFDRLSGTLEYYTRTSSDLLLSKPYAPSLGFTSRIENVGVIENKGIEFSINYDVFKSDFSWNTGIVLSNNSNEILELADGNFYDGQIYRGEGYSMNNIRAVEWAGVNRETGAPQWYKRYLTVDNVKVYYREKEELEEYYLPKKDGSKYIIGESGKEITSDWGQAAQVDWGDALPKVYGAWNNDMSYKNFDLSFQFSYSFGGLAYNDLAGVTHHDGAVPSKNLLDDAVDSWNENNKDSKRPLYVYNDPSKGWYRSSRFLEDLDYVKLKQVNLGYNFDKSLLKKLKLNGLRVYVLGENLLTFTNFTGYDPELSLNNTTGNGVPPATSVCFGINVTF